jgi:cell division septal protein FtsQ
VVKRPHLLTLPAEGVRPLLFWPLPARLLACAAALTAVLGLSYLAARETSLFAVDAIEVRGAPPLVERAVRDAAAQFVGESLVGLDGDELRRRLDALPSVRSFRYDRAFPDTLRIDVVPEKPAAVLRRGADSWLLSDRGRVIRAVERGALGRYGRIWVGGAAPIVPGAVLTDETTSAALSALTQLPRNFPVRIVSARAEDGSLSLRLAGGTELRLGDEGSVALKLAVAARVLRTLPVEERSALAYLDVSLPERPVAADKSQVSG